MYLELDGNRSTCLTTVGSYPNEQFRLIAAPEPYAISRIVIEYKHNSRFRFGFVVVVVVVFVCSFGFFFWVFLLFFLGGGGGWFVVTASNFDLYSALMAIELWGPHLLWHGATVYNMGLSEDPWHSHLLPSVKLAVELSQPRSVAAGIWTPNLRMRDEHSNRLRHHIV